MDEYSVATVVKVTMTHTEEKVRWTGDQIFYYRIFPVVFLVGALAICIMWSLIGWELWDLRGIMMELEGPPSPDGDPQSLHYATIFWKVFPLLLSALPWVALCVSLGLGFAILKWQQSWIRKNEDALLRFYISPRHKELSFLRRRGIEMRFLAPFLVFVVVHIIDNWFSVTAPLYVGTGIATTVMAPQFFLYKDLNRIYQTAKDNVAVQ